MKRNQSGMTLLECIVVMGVVVAIFVFFVWPSMTRPKVSVTRIKCVSSLRNVALAFRIWATDNGDQFPMMVSTNEGGSLEFTHDMDKIFRHFAVASNELSTPKFLICPQDKAKKEALNFSSNPQTGFTSNNSISYFVGVNADETAPQGFLSGDRNILTADRKQITSAALLTIPSGGKEAEYESISWSKDIHQLQGNVALGDGSVQQYSTSRLREAFMNAPTNSVLAIPED